MCGDELIQRYYAGQPGVGGVGQVGMGDAGQWWKAVEKYYDAYDAYLSQLRGGAGGTGGGVGVDAHLYGVVPPVWVGCGNGVEWRSVCGVGKLGESAVGVDKVHFASAGNARTDRNDGNGAATAANHDSGSGEDSIGEKPKSTGGTLKPVDGGVSARTLANRAKRAKGKQRKLRKRGLDGNWRESSWKEVDGDLKESSKQKWIAQNQLAALRAQRELEVLKANDIDAEKKRYRTKVRVQTERNMVAIEKTHATLKATDNVSRDELDAEDAGSRVCTLVSDNSGSISPNSSVSEAEVRKMQKDLADSQSEVEKLRSCLEKFRLNPDYAEYYGKTDWTLDDNGTLDEERKAIINEVWPGGYVIRTEGVVDGRKRMVVHGFE